MHSLYRCFHPLLHCRRPGGRSACRDNRNLHYRPVFAALALGSLDLNRNPHLRWHLRYSDRHYGRYFQYCRYCRITCTDLGISLRLNCSLPFSDDGFPSLPKPVFSRRRSPLYLQGYRYGQPAGTAVPVGLEVVSKVAAPGLLSSSRFIDITVSSPGCRSPLGGDSFSLSKVYVIACPILFLILKSLWRRLSERSISFLQALQKLRRRNRWNQSPSEKHCFLQSRTVAIYRPNTGQNNYKESRTANQRFIKVKPPTGLSPSALIVFVVRGTIVV